MVMSRDQNAGRSHDIKTDNSSFEMVEEFKYLGTALTNQNSIEEEIKSRLKSGSACYQSVRNRYVYQFATQKFKDYDIQTIILPVLYGCETWSLTLRKERTLRVSEDRVLRRIFWPRRTR